MIESSFSRPDDAFDEAVRLRQARRHEEALALSLQLVDGQFGAPAAMLVQEAWLEALRALATLERWTQAEDLALEALDRFPDNGLFWFELGQCRFHLGKTGEAEAAAGRAVELRPRLREARALLATIRAGGEQPASAAQVHPWPRSTAKFRNARKVVANYMLRGREPDRFIAGDTVFSAFGSCFAGNLAQRLALAGYAVHHEHIGEEVNSTYANCHLLSWIETGPTDGPTEAMEQAFGAAMRARFRSWLAKTDAVILTLGVAPCFFHRRTGEFGFVSGIVSATARSVLMSHYEMRTTTVSENVENIQAIRDSLARLCPRRPKLVMTVSPVSLAGTTEFESAVEADCISKSTLRLACHEAISARPEGVVYWPSFEMVRWLGAHYGREHPPAFGEDDGNSHHVSQWLVDMIIELFLQHHGTAPAGLEAREPQRPAQA